MTNRQQVSFSATQDHESACAQVVSLFRGRWLKGYVRGKLRTDPMYDAVFERLRGSPLPILDIGCGVGILPFYLRQRGLCQPMTGVDCDAGRIAVAQRIAAEHYRNLSFIHQDARTPIEFQGQVAMLDVLHYLNDDDQRQLLNNISEGVAPGGAAVIRECRRDSSNRFKLTNVEEHIARALRWYKGRIISFPTAQTIAQPFRARGFREEILPMWGATPFNNYLFVFRRPANSAASLGTTNE